MREIESLFFYSSMFIFVPFYSLHTEFLVSLVRHQHAFGYSLFVVTRFTYLSLVLGFPLLTRFLFEYSQIICELMKKRVVSRAADGRDSFTIGSQRFNK